MGQAAPAMNSNPGAFLPRYSIALASATALAYEILLVRLFSISQWHHFAYMVISLALLGYGVSGAVLALAQHRLLRRFEVAFFVNLLLFGLAMAGSYAAANRLAFNPEQILWDAGQWGRLAAVYLSLSLPFFFVANAIGLALMRFRPRAALIYGADLIGAGLGSLSVIAVLFVLFPDAALKLFCLLGVLSAGLAAVELRRRGPGFVVAPVLAAILIALAPKTWMDTAGSPYKGLNQTLRISGTEVIERRSSPLGLISILKSPVIPLRHAPGLSFNATQEPPEQLGLFIDGDGPAAINRVRAGDGRLDYLDQLTWALPYHLRPLQRVLILGAGGGSEVLQALQQGVRHIDAVELNPQIVDLVRQQYGDFSGHIYADERVRVHTGEARGFVKTSARRYDLIQVALLDSFAASSAGLYALTESYLYTVEALQAYFDKLAPQGYLVISRWMKLPPRDSLKLFVTAVAALQRAGIDDPGEHLALVRSWQTGSLIVKRSAFEPAERESIREFCDTRGFDISYLPGLRDDEVNRFNIMHEPLPWHAAQALLGADRGVFMSRYKFNLAPATDDRPYFFHFFKWRTLPEILSLYGRGGVPLLDTGYLILVATLAQAVFASLLLILVPLWIHRWREPAQSAGGGRGRVFVYFAALGLAFLFLEIAFIQKFILFLHHPLYAVTVVLTAFLLFAGAGSYFSGRFALDGRLTVVPFIAIALVSLLYLAGLDRLFTALAVLPDWLRILTSLVLIAPLAFCMGMPFPLGMARLGEYAPALIPWAWGINGCASVISAVAATLLAMHAGFAVVVAAACALYLLAAASLPGARS
jgi:hypothetical protein